MLSQFNQYQSLIKIYDLEFYTSVFILKGKSLYVKIALKVSILADSGCWLSGQISILHNLHH